ncbi:hypothetical protein V6N13_125784 [Hibiscus sabdariffa]
MLPSVILTTGICTSQKRQQTTIAALSEAQDKTNAAAAAAAAASSFLKALDAINISAKIADSWSCLSPQHHLLKQPFFT